MTEQTIADTAMTTPASCGYAPLPKRNGVKTLMPASWLKRGVRLEYQAGGECTQPAMANGRCRMHGGRSLRGVAHPSYRHGRFSKSIPARLSQSYEEALADPRRLELADELAVLIARNRGMLESLYSGESDGLWRRLRNHKRRMERARSDGDQDAAELHLNTIMHLIERGANDGERWAELMKNVDQQRKLAESERKRLVEAHQMVTTEELMAFMRAVLAIITRHVRDERIRRAIGFDIEALVNSSGNGTIG